MTAHKKNQRGFTLIATAVSAIVLIGMLGLAVDLGRVYITKNEAQAFTDVAALRAAQKLDGTMAGLDRARAAARNTPMKWNFATTAFSNLNIEFSTDMINWTDSPASAGAYWYVRVGAPQNSVGILFMQAVGAPNSLLVPSRSVGGKNPAGIDEFGQGTLPFAPIAHDPNVVGWGFSKGDVLTLRWPPGNNPGGNGAAQMNDICPADRIQTYLDLVNQGQTADKGYIQENSADAIREAIEDDHMDYTVTLWDTVSMTGGLKQTQLDSLENRSAQDSINDTDDYDSYMARHDPNRPYRRIGIVPITSGPLESTVMKNGVATTVPPNTVIGFAKVFLPMRQTYATTGASGNGTAMALCAIFIGPANAPDSSDGQTSSGTNFVRLMQ